MKYANLKSAAAGATNFEGVLHKAEQDNWEWSHAREQIRQGSPDVVAHFGGIGTKGRKLSTTDIKLGLTETLARMAVARAEVTLAKRELAMYAARIAKGQ